MIGIPRTTRNNWTVYDVPLTCRIEIPDINVTIEDQYTIGLHLNTVTGAWEGGVNSHNGVGCVWFDTWATGTTQAAVVREIANRLTMNVKPEYKIDEGGEE